MLESRYNRICVRGTPMWNDDTQALCKPYSPYRTLGAVRLAGPALYPSAAAGGSFEALLVQGVRPARYPEP